MTSRPNLSRYTILLTEPDRLEILRRHNEGEPFVFAIFNTVLPPWAKESCEAIAIEGDIYHPDCKVSFLAQYTNL